MRGRGGQAWAEAPLAQNRKGVGGEGRLGQVPQYLMQMFRFSGVSSTGILFPHLNFQGLPRA